MISSPRPLALVTGASAGIGAQFCRSLARRGFDLVLTARRADRLDALGTELSAAHGISAQSIPMDLSQADADRAILESLEGRPIALLVNNAGYSIPQSFGAVPWEDQRAFLMTLVLNACGLAHGVLRGMVARQSGGIINVASVAGFAPGVAGHTLYPGAKSLMIKFSEALDAEYRQQGIRVTALCPGFVRTEFAEANGTSDQMRHIPRFMVQSVEKVVEGGLRANERGQVVVTPGWTTTLGAAALSYLPHGLVRAVVMRGSARYHRDTD